MSGNGDKTSGGTRNYAKQPGTLGKRRSEFDKLMGSGDYDRKNSIFDKSGGFVVIHNEHNLKDGEKEAAQKLARKDYKVYLDRERSTVFKQTTKDGRIYHSHIDIKSVKIAGNNTIKTAMEKASKQGAETVVILQRSHAITREYITSQIKLFREKSPQRAREKIKWVIVVGMNGNVHRRPV